MAAIEAEGFAWQHKVSNQRIGCGYNAAPPLSRGLFNVYCQASPSASIAAKGCSYSGLCKPMGRLSGGSYESA